ncbi:MAG: trigger factor [Piscirickettsiaceae bacterium]|nr:MAG: trigger factor [Piscirickettsiaceae bacterium]PCI66471.1 MAG: trigger factor [Piscirickettsiaceae bacterium]
MQVSIESNSGLKKTMTIVVPQEEVDTAINKRLEDVKRTARIDGFRPGKIPMSVIKSKFGKSIRAEALSELTQSFFYKAIMEEKINPASQPVITPNENDKDGFEFSASFEVYPDVKVAAIDKLELDKPSSEVADSDIDDMVEKLRTQKSVWNVIEAKAEDGHRVTINFEGHVGDMSISDEPIKSFPVVIGSNNMIPGFEEKLIGSSTGDSLSFEVTFPDDYQEKDFAGKIGKFDVDVDKVEASELPEIDETFIKEFGVESGVLKDFRADLSKNMSMELDRALASKRKQIVMDAIIENNELDVPDALVDNEISQMMSSLKEKAQQAQQPTDMDLPKELFEDQAKRRVKLGLLLSEIIKDNDIKADADRVQERIKEFAQTYQSPEDVINWYNSNPQELNKIESVVLEDQLVDWVLENAKINETTISFKELMAPASPSI